MVPDSATNPDACDLEREATAVLADDRAQASVLHLPGERDRHRRQLARVIELATLALEAAGESGDTRTFAKARLTLARAHAARAQDARHGAGQLSLGSQRAPTCEACDDGWRRVEAIVAVAEASAEAAARIAVELADPRAQSAARAADIAARDARRLVDERNHAYTFHADPSFSFGEGWYLSAAAVLHESVAIQIEPDRPQTAQAALFLRQVGLTPRLVPYRSRPRANKHLPELIARGFRADPLAAQRRLRAAFLGDGTVARAIADWVDQRLAGVPARAKVLLWIRDGRHHPMRNSTQPELLDLARRSVAAGLIPVMVGDRIRDGQFPPGAIDMTLFWKDAVFQGVDMRRAQLQFFEHLRAAHGLVGQLGVTTAGMDGPALMGLPTMYLTDRENVRLGTWVAVVPGYEEIVRGEGYLERIDQRLRRWSSELQDRRTR